jgi:hypothetical protein
MGVDIQVWRARIGVHNNNTLNISPNPTVKCKMSMMQLFDIFSIRDCCSWLFYSLSGSL